MICFSRCIYLKVGYPILIIKGGKISTLLTSCLQCIERVSVCRSSTILKQSLKQVGTKFDPLHHPSEVLSVLRSLLTLFWIPGPSHKEKQ